MINNRLRFAFFIALQIATALASVMTFLDWRKNPSGLFQGDGGTHWGVVAETWWSWFWPSAIVVGIAALVILLLRRGR
ncbi:MAG: hypothetical protein AAGN66_20425 [Acidobacteriota bacterium]